MIKFPDLKISLAAFTALRPPQCILAGPKGTHNVCVCKIHGNIRLKFNGLKQELLRKKFDFKKTYRDYLNDMVCLNATGDCFLSNCKSCPNSVIILDELKEILQSCSVEKITFNQWLTTDRYIS